MKQIAEIIATFFFVGYFPVAPGTVGSLFAIFIYFFIYRSFFLYIFITALFLLFGFLFSGRAEKSIKRKDAPCIIIDEMAGMLLSLIGIPFRFREIFIVFLLFRIFDTLKVPPANILQKKSGSIGIMADDLVAAIYTIIITQIVLRFLM